jgi:hypothetical protein
VSIQFLQYSYSCNNLKRQGHPFSPATVHVLDIRFHFVHACSFVHGSSPFQTGRYEGKSRAGEQRESDLKTHRKEKAKAEPLDLWLRTGRLEHIF